MTKKKKILIVDDEVAVLVIHESFFQKLGYAVETATSGEEALDLMGSGTFYAVLADLKMPGMGGLEMCREMRRSGFKGKIIAVTGHPDKFEFSTCREAGFDGYFSKPVELELLGQAVEATAGRS